MLSLIEAMREYIAILVGLAAGAVAHFGSRISQGQELTLKHVIGFSMQLGLIGIIAAVTTRMMGITNDDMRALAAGVLAVSANEVVQWAKRKGWMRFVPDPATAQYDKQHRDED